MHVLPHVPLLNQMWHPGMQPHPHRNRAAAKRRRRHQDVARACCDSDPCTGVYRDPTWRAAAGPLDLSGVNTCAHVEAELGESVVDRERATNCSGGSVEQSKEPVAGGIDL